LKRATELDPNFAMANAQMGTAYFSSNQPRLGSAATTRAYELRERVSEREKLYIESHYYVIVTGEEDKAIEVYQLWRKIYPFDTDPYINLAALYDNMGQHEEAIREETDALRLGANNGTVYANLANSYINLNQFDKADEILHEAEKRKVESRLFQGLRYQLAFARNNQAEMERQVAAATGEPVVESWLLALQADTEAYYGRLSTARKYTQRAVTSARHDGDEDTVLMYVMIGALREAEVGNRQLAKKQAGATMAHDPGVQALSLGALALARANERQKALALVRDLTRRFPKNTSLNEYWLPSVRAAVELDRGAPSQAIEYLESTRRYELATPPVPTNVLPYPVYLRGESYLAAGLPDKAQVEFQKILDHPGLAGNYILGALAHLGLGRAYAMQAGVPVAPRTAMSSARHTNDHTLTQADALAKGRSAYQDFFAIWKDADPDIPLLKQARMEYRKLQ
jgi:tetratricopeptide (TPR) repeat protein